MADNKLPDIVFPIRPSKSIQNVRETLMNCLHKRFATLGDAQKLAYHHINMSRPLCPIRLASHPVRRI